MRFVLFGAVTQVLEPKDEIMIVRGLMALLKLVANPLTYLSIESKLYLSCRSAA